MTNKVGTSSIENPGPINLSESTTEELQTINNEAVKRLAERAKSEGSSPLSLRNTGHDSVYHSKT